MIRKLASGGYRLYSRKLNPSTGKRRNLGTFKRVLQPKSTNAKCSTSRGTEKHDGSLRDREGLTSGGTLCVAKDSRQDRREAVNVFFFRAARFR